MEKIKTSRRFRDALGHLLKKMKKKKKKKMENSRVLWTALFRYNMNIVTVFAARLEPVKLSDVPEKAYNSRSSEFVSFLAHALIRAIPT